MYPPVVTYVIESTQLSLICSSVISVSGLAVVDQMWLDPNGDTVSAFSNYALQPVNRSSAGVYTCVTILVSNIGGPASVNASTQVVVYCTSIMLMNWIHITYAFFYLSDPPKILPLQATTYVIQGLGVQLQCAFDGLPVPTITWSFSGENAPGNIGVTLNVTVITLSSLTGLNTGNYTCTASNLAGMSAASTQLFVQGMYYFSQIDSLKIIT